MQALTLPTLHCSGDAGQFRDGMLAVVGRQDRQVKINGKRTELDEVEKGISMAAELSGIKMAKIAVIVTSVGKLQAFVTPETVNVDELRKLVKSGMPEHMVEPYLTMPYLCHHSCLL